VVDATMEGLSWVRKHIEQADTDLLRMVKLICERVMGDEADAIGGAPTASVRMNARTAATATAQGLGHPDRHDRPGRSQAP
jgi:hypothetical protein